MPTAKFLEQSQRPPRIKERFAPVLHFLLMPRFYFDFVDEVGTFIDQDGEEFADPDAAMREAFAALGDAGRDFARRHSVGRLTIRVRDSEGAVIEVSAIFEAKLIKR
jgi:hypothetical protein